MVWKEAGKWKKDSGGENRDLVASRLMGSVKNWFVSGSVRRQFFSEGFRKRIFLGSFRNSEGFFRECWRNRGLFMFGRTYFLSNPHFLSHRIWHQMKELFGELHFSQIICHHQFFLVSYMFGDLHFTQSICLCLNSIMKRCYTKYAAFLPTTYDRWNFMNSHFLLEPGDI